jgi:hypothetical protein
MNRNMNNLRVILAVVIALWFAGFLYMSGGVGGGNGGINDETWAARLRSAEEKMAQLDAVNKKNERLIENLK